MPGITLDPADAAELAETLVLLTEWLSGSQKKGPRRQLRRLHRPPRLQHRRPLRRPAPVRFPPRRQRRRRTLRRAHPMITNCALPHPPLDKITRITPTMRLSRTGVCSCDGCAYRPDLRGERNIAVSPPVRTYGSYGCPDCYAVLAIRPVHAVSTLDGSGL